MDSNRSSELDKTKTKVAKHRKRRIGKRSGKDTIEPIVTALIPSSGSPLGGLLVTIVGDNLVSREFNSVSVTDVSEDEGQNFAVWFRRWDGTGNVIEVPCIIDRMFALHAQPLGGQGFLVCQTEPMNDFKNNWKLRLEIDGIPIHTPFTINFSEGNSPSTEYFYPQAAAAATPLSQWDYAGAHWSEWFDVDQTTDNVEDESLHLHIRDNRQFFQNCFNPIDIEVFDKWANDIYQPSTNENADGKTMPTFSDTMRGFKCDNSKQTIVAQCPDVMVRYRCLPNVMEMQGRIYTDVHARSDAKSIHVNRLMGYPKLRNDQDGFTAECSNHLNDGQGCGNRGDCGINTRLNLKLISGNDGVIQFLPKASIPGAYNFTFNTLHNGNAVVNKRLNNYLTNEQLYPANFEIFPYISNVWPTSGSVYGGTLITIDGSGFVNDDLGGEVFVEIGGTPCILQEMTETKIICRTQATTMVENEVFGKNRIYFTVVENLDYKGLDISADGWKIERADSPEACYTMCRYSASCVLYWFSSGQCFHFDYYNSVIWETSSNGSIGGYIENRDRNNETECMTGRGQFYIGRVAVTASGRKCMANTFCRNLSPETNR